MKKKRKEIDPIVATIIIVLITVAAVTILYYAVSQLIIEQEIKITDNDCKNIGNTTEYINLTEQFYNAKFRIDKSTMKSYNITNNEVFCTIRALFPSGVTTEEYEINIITEITLKLKYDSLIEERGRRR